MINNSISRIDVVEELIEKGDLDSLKDIKYIKYLKNEEEYTALHFAALYRQLDIMQWLITEKFMDVNAVTAQGRTPLMFAVMGGYSEIVESLIYSTYSHNTDVSVDVNVDDNDGATALMFAAQYGHVEIARLLIFGGHYKKFYGDIASSSGPLLIDQSKRAESLTTKVATSLVESISKQAFRGFNKISDVNTVDLDGWTPLHYAAIHGKLEMVRFLVVEAKANVLARTRELEQTPLHLASGKSHLEIVKWFILKAKVPIEIKDKFGFTPLLLAIAGNKQVLETWSVISKQKKLITWLIEAGANLNAVDCSRRDILMIAGLVDALPLVEWLVLKKKLSIHRKDSQGGSVLFLSKGTSHYWLALYHYLIEDKQNKDKDELIELILNYSGDHKAELYIACLKLLLRFQAKVLLEKYGKVLLNGISSLDRSILHKLRQFFIKHNYVDLMEPLEKLAGEYQDDYVVHDANIGLSLRKITLGLAQLQVLEKCINLRKGQIHLFSLENVKFDSEESKNYFKNLLLFFTSREYSSLSYISLSEMSLEDIEYIVKVISDSQFRGNLILDDNSITYRMARNIVASLSNGTCEVEYLSLKNNLIEQVDELTFEMEFVKKNKKSFYINVQENFISCKNVLKENSIFRVSSERPLPSLLFPEHQIDKNKSFAYFIINKKGRLNEHAMLGYEGFEESRQRYFEIAHLCYDKDNKKIRIEKYLREETPETSSLALALDYIKEYCHVVCFSVNPESIKDIREAIEKEIREGVFNADVYKTILLDINPFKLYRSENDLDDAIKLNCVKWILIKLNKYCRLDLKPDHVCRPSTTLSGFLNHPSAIAHRIPNIERQSFKPKQAPEIKPHKEDELSSDEAEEKKPPCLVM